jgi:hypothetical protein
MRQAEGSMAKVHESQSLPVSVEEAWALVGGFNALPEWHPAVRVSTLEDGGRVRRLELANGAALIERMFSFDESKRSYAYSIEEGPLPVSGYRSTVSVLAQPSEGGCRVEWSGEFSPHGATEPEAVAVIRGIYRAGLDRLGERFAR